MPKSLKTSSSSSDIPNVIATDTILNLNQTQIVDVWESNFEVELYKIMDLIEVYNMISLVIFISMKKLFIIASGY